MLLCSSSASPSCTTHRVQPKPTRDTPGPENLLLCDAIGTALGRPLATTQIGALLEVARAYGPQPPARSSAAEVVTLVDAYMAGTVLMGLVVNAALGWWWADPLAVCYGLKEGWEALHHDRAPVSGRT